MAFAKADEQPYGNDEKRERQRKAPPEHDEFVTTACRLVALVGGPPRGAYMRSRITSESNMLRKIAKAIAMIQEAIFSRRAGLEYA